MSEFRHRPERPSWLCQRDDDEWPCALARKVLTETFVGAEEELSRHMARLQIVAADDLGVADPASLYGRFVRWTRTAADQMRQVREDQASRASRAAAPVVSLQPPKPLTDLAVRRVTVILPIKVGDTITVKEADCYLGYGDVTLRITELPPGHLPDGSDWIQVTGIEIAPDGEEIGERTTLVRTSALRSPSS